MYGPSTRELRWEDDVDGQDTLAHVGWQLALLPFATMKDTAIHREIRLEHATTSACRSGLEREPEDIRPYWRG